MLFKALVEFDSELSKLYTNHRFVGIDEVGRGALAGPVIACAFSWKSNLLRKTKSSFPKALYILNDSKQLSRQERQNLYLPLKKSGVFAIGYASVCEIEKLNILNATFLAMKRAYDNLQAVLGENEYYVLVDGNKFNPYINCMQLPIVDGDTKSSLIAAASVIAKVYRDNLMQKISLLSKYKKYGWNRNVGYGTKTHINAIEMCGLTPFHRKLFLRKITNTLKSSKLSELL